MEYGDEDFIDWMALLVENQEEKGEEEEYDN